MWRLSLVFASLVLVFSPSLSLAQESNDVAYLAFSAENLALRSLQSRARLAMLAEGVGAVDPSKILELGDVVDDRVKWLGAARLRACSGGQRRSAAQFDSDLSSLLESLDFGEYEAAKVKVRPSTRASPASPSSCPTSRFRGSGFCLPVCALAWARSVRRKPT